MSAADFPNESINGVPSFGRSVPVMPRDQVNDDEWLSNLRGYLLACIGDAEGLVAVERHRALRLTAGQVQVLAEALGLVDAALASPPLDELCSSPKSVPLPVSASSVEARRAGNQEAGDGHSPSSGGGS